MKKQSIGNMDRNKLDIKIQKGLDGRRKQAGKFDNKAALKFVANTWINNTFGKMRTSLAVGNARRVSGQWKVDIQVDGTKKVIGHVNIDDEMKIADFTPITVMKNGARRNKARLGSDIVHGDVKLKKHRMSCADSMVECAKLKDNSVDLLLTDPPYGISSPYATERQIPRRVRKNGGDFIMPKGEFGEWDHDSDPAAWTKVVLPKIKGWAVIFCAHVQIKDYTEILSGNGFVAVNALVWHKTNPVPFNHKFKMLSAWESAVMGKRPSTKFNGKSVHNVFTYKSPSPAQRIHPTQKPLGLMEELIQLMSDKGDLVLDPFGGSATTMIAAMNQNRKSITYENDPKMYKLASQRVKSHLGSYE
ncbi:DNA modification methylase [Cenarchaeum symbiosum A]|uniref:Type II methyltransferase n=1 Tax=Cenarchaeum symbiosum (strain A) TaxID=414004 RepID=A0RXI0_CENSY|nr:DNA modification methylase [Cenarchaeum symbiosum A]